MSGNRNTSDRSGGSSTERRKERKKSNQDLVTVRVALSVTTPEDLILVSSVGVFVICVAFVV